MATSLSRFQLLAEALEKLMAARSRAEILAITLEFARRLVEASGVSIVLREGDECFYAHENSPAGPLWQGRRFPLLSCISGWTMVHGETAVIEDAFKDDRIPHAVYEPTFVKSLVMVPVGRPLAHAAIGAYWDRVRKPNDEEVAVLQSLARAAGAALEQQATADRLQESAQHFQYVTLATHDVIWDWCLEDDTLWLSEDAASILGDMRLKEVCSFEGWMKLVDPADRKRVESSFRACVMPKEEQWCAEYRLLLEDGVHADVLHRCYLVRDARGNARRLVGSVLNQTQRKQIEHKLREQAALLDNATEAIAVYSPDGKIIYWNRAAEQRYGWPASRVLGRPAAEVIYGGDQDRAFATALGKALSQGEHSCRIFQTRSDGTSLVAHLHLALVRDDHDKPRAVLSFQHDLSERVELERRLFQAQKLESLGRLTGGIAHDFNNLLTVVNGNAEILLERLSGDSALAELARLIHLAGEKATQLTSRLLAFARRQALEPEAADPREVVAELRPLLLRAAGDSVQLTVSCDAAVNAVFVDRVQLESALLNLCINACDAMPEGGSLTVRIENAAPGKYRAEDGTAVAGDYVMISVQDSGTGMSQEVRARAFEPFFSTKNGGARSGLGLSMVYGFATQSNGNVYIDSIEGQGTTVSLLLPGVPREAARAGPALQARAAVPAARVLMVEDSELVRTNGARWLRGMGLDVVTACDGMEALRVLEEDSAFDLLFVDIMLPGGMNGFELVQRVRSLASQLPVLYTSGHLRDPVEETVRREGLQLLRKPYKQSTLAEKVKEVLGSAHTGFLHGTRSRVVKRTT